MRLSEISPPRRAKIQIALDEGGLRCAWRKGNVYVPFALLADAKVEKRALGGARLILIAKDADELALDVEEPLAVHRAIVSHLVDGAAAGRAPAGLARDGRALDVWLDDVTHRADAAGYRDPGVDHAALASFLSDEHTPIDARAAAAFVLVGEASPELLRATARVFVEHALPPLVLVAAWLAPGGTALIPDDVLADANAYLPPADAKLAKNARPSADATRAPLVAAALADALAEARATPPAAHPKRRRLQPSAGTGMDMRWVGRTWNI